MNKLKNSLTIITYHYIREINKANKGLKFLSIKNFIKQLDYLNKSYHIVTPDEAKFMLKHKRFNNKFCWLTFDDGYKEHYDIVFHELEKRKLKGSFFPVVKCTTQKEILAVNKIQFIIAKIDKDLVLKKIQNYYDKKFINGLDFNKFIKTLDLNYRFEFDNKKTILIKRLLQKSLPEKDRIYLTNYFFNKYIKTKTDINFKEMYLSISNLKEMHSNGHEIGLHSYDHQHLDILPEHKQKFQINKSINFLKKNNLMIKDLTLNYPYGSNNSITRKIIKNNQYIKFGLTVMPGIIYSNNVNFYSLPRVDTNEIQS